MPVIRADVTRCRGYGNCVIAARDVFEIDDNGTVAVLRAEVDESERAKVQEAVRVCPFSALAIEGGMR